MEEINRRIENKNKLNFILYSVVLFYWKAVVLQEMNIQIMLASLALLVSGINILVTVGIFFGKLQSQEANFAKRIDEINEEIETMKEDFVNKDMCNLKHTFTDKALEDIKDTLVRLEQKIDNFTHTN